MCTCMAHVIALVNNMHISLSDEVNMFSYFKNVDSRNFIIWGSICMHQKKFAGHLNPNWLILSFDWFLTFCVVFHYFSHPFI